MIQLKSVLLFLALVFGCSARELLGYHARIGIPHADAIKSFEEKAIRIIGGSPAQLGAFYYQAGLLINLSTGWQSVCTGTLVSPTRVLTAAQCWWDGRLQADSFTVVLGSVTLFKGGTRVVTGDVSTHPDWNPEGLTHDIAVARIEPVALSNNINVVTLPSLSDASCDFAGHTGTASGYGKTRDDQSIVPASQTLHIADLPIISNSVCQQADPSISLHGSHLCTSGAGGVGTCDGDNGGPLTIVRDRQRVLVGIISFGLGFGCEFGFPSVYTRVTAFLPWIQANM